MHATNGGLDHPAGQPVARPQARAARMGLLWGLGHGTTLVLVGLSLVLTDRELRADGAGVGRFRHGFRSVVRPGTRRVPLLLLDGGLS